MTCKLYLRIRMRGKMRSIAAAPLENQESQSEKKGKTGAKGRQARACFAQFFTINSVKQQNFKRRN